MQKPIDLAKELWPVCRSITGQGVRDTLQILKRKNPNLKVKSIKSGRKIFDWRVPQEWNIKDGWVKNMDGEKLISFKENNLHILGYSIPINRVITKKELEGHLYSIPEMPTAIPYVTSYYKKRWGFCVEEVRRKTIMGQQGPFEVMIDSSFLSSGVMNYGEILIKGKQKDEIFISTYICHPSMANNEISGPVVASYIANWLSSQEKLNYTYRIVFIPETIGSIAYIQKHKNRLKKRIKAGFNLTCIGDERDYSYLPSRNGNTYADKVAKFVLESIKKDFKCYSWLDRGSDERQYCSPGIDLPVCSIMRTKYGEYPEYHTSLDDFKVVTNTGLEGGIMAMKKIINVLENNHIYKMNFYCEPQLGKRGLYPTLSKEKNQLEAKKILNVASYCDGWNDLVDISKLCELEFDEAAKIVKLLVSKGVLRNEIDRRSHLAKIKRLLGLARRFNKWWKTASSY
ncbi:DUF4910 domain-containing protein [Prochlorococcus marinus]|uniref:DUF4910 domain-containing protein n=1 Tax=Prochlorococcus marinus TaxID=1219 RepID=UPI0007B3D72F|nr:DUF4910 domain-containing protein [Prochlorococcus marinus]KZR73699.1 hypothetical protein PMIT1320_02294 [Prochlorococcus marinus str. MIT 1320]